MEIKINCNTITMIVVVLFFSTIYCFAFFAGTMYPLCPECPETEIIKIETQFLPSPAKNLDKDAWEYEYKDGLWGPGLTKSVMCY